VATCSPSPASAPLLAVRAVSIGGVLHVVLSGELDVDTAQRLIDAVQHARTGDERKLLVDLAELTFVDAFGLCALERAADIVTGDFARLQLRGATALVAYVLRLCSLGPIPEPEPAPDPQVAPLGTAHGRLRARARGRRRLSIVRPQIS
jgi:anti-anti-sigma factor